MSSSTSFRPIALSPAQQAEVARRARLERLADRLLPALAEQASQRVELAAGCGQISSIDGQALEARIAAASSVAAFMDLMESVPAAMVFTPTLTSSAHTPYHQGQRLNHGASAHSASGLPTASGGNQVGSRLDDASRGTLPSVGSLPPNRQGVPTGGCVLPSPGALLCTDDRSDSAPAAATLASARWDLVAQRVRLDSLIDEADEHGTDITDEVADARLLLDSAQAFAEAGDLGMLDQQLRSLSQRIDEIERTVDDVVVRAATRQETLDQLRRIAEERLGFRVGVVHKGETARVEATSADGRTLTLALTRDGDADVLVSTVTDIGNAVPEGTPGAGELCEPSVYTAQELHRAIDEAAALDGGRVSVRSAPTRGHPDARSGSSASVRRSRSTPTKQMRRNS